MHIKYKMVGTAVTAAAATAAAATGAAAQGLPGDLARWDGPYIGGMAGIAYQNSSPTGTNGTLTLLAPPNGTVGSTETAPNSSIVNPDLGARAGWNWHSNRLVYGGEMDFSWMGANSAKGTGAQPIRIDYSYGGGYNAQGTSVRTSKVTSMFTFRGRIGLNLDGISDGTLPYLTAGLAVGHQKSSWATSVAGYSAAAVSKSSWLPGVVLGAGIEQQIDGHWSVRGDFQWIDLATQKLSTPSSSNFGYTGSGHLNFHNTVGIATFGVDYRF